MTIVIAKTIEKPRFLLKLDIQHFAEGEVIQGGYIPDDSPTIENPLLSSDDSVPEPFVNQPEGQEAAPLLDGQAIDPNQVEQPPVFDFGGRQVNPGDADSLKGLHDDWTQSQRYIQQLQQERQQLMQQQQQILQMQQAQQAQVQPPTQEEQPFDTDAFLEKFYEKPNEAIASVTQKAVEQAISQMRQEYEPIVKERQYQNMINQVSSKHQDFQQFIPQISELVSQIGEEESNRIGLENIYFMAKGRVPQQDPNQMVNNQLNDPNFITQHVMGNEQIRNQIYQEMMQQKQQTQPKAPVMGNNYGGQASFANQNAPRSIEEASKLARQYFNSK